jgi:hypothetical protein
MGAGIQRRQSAMTPVRHLQPMQLGHQLGGHLDGGPFAGVDAGSTIGRACTYLCSAADRADADVIVAVSTTNLTDIRQATPEFAVAGKWLGMLKEIAPALCGLASRSVPKHRRNPNSTRKRSRLRRPRSASSPHNWPTITGRPGRMPRSRSIGLFGGKGAAALMNGPGPRASHWYVFAELDLSPAGSNSMRLWLTRERLTLLYQIVLARWDRNLLL